MTDTPRVPARSDDDLAAVLAARDWSESPLGPPEEWPSLLRTMVNVVVSSRFSMWMGWGPDLLFFYNHAYARATLGVKHPWALGRPTRDVWPEIHDEIGPRLQMVMEGGEATWDEALLLFLERGGYREETYHTFSYSPIVDVDGTVAGMLCVVTEETQRVLAERRMATLRDLASELSSARTEAAVFEATSTVLGQNLWDLPYTATYIFEGDGAARLVATTGVGPGDRVAPHLVARGDDGPWPLGRVAADRSSRLWTSPGGPDGLPTGAWADPSRQALLVPLVEGGQSAPSGVFVAGLNPYREIDADYRGFAELVAGSVASGVAAARAYEAERRRAESLAELDRAKTEFFSNVSHEFRTPLTLILAPADDAMKDDLAPLEGVQRARVEIIARNARRLRRLVNDMLDFARIEGGRLPAETVPTDLVEFTRDVAMSFAPVIERAGLRLGLELEPLGATVHVDRDMWEKILLNLLSNALKFTLEGGITVSLRGRDDTVVLAVSDTGVGIPADHQDRLFERFYRVPGAGGRSHEGTGIGLALVAELARLHGGDVSVVSSEGQGSTFEVVVPYGTFTGSTPAGSRESSIAAYLDEALLWVGPDQTEPVDATLVRSAAGTTAAARVLVVDDNPDMRAYLARILRPYWNVQVASDGVEALEVITRHRPDLVLTDVMMPRLDGFGLLSAVRSNPVTATVPIVFLSARAGEESAIEGLEAGADDYLVKPFSGLELLARVRSNLELAALRNHESAWRGALIESLYDAVVVLDRNGTLIEANGAFEELLGYPRAALPYPPPFPWIYDPETDPEAARAAIDGHQRLISDGRLVATFPLRHREGRRVEVAVAANAVGEGDDRRYVVALHDVTVEVAAAERDAALARLGIGLAEAGDVRQVYEAGLTELTQVFDASAALIVEAGQAGLTIVASSRDDADLAPDLGEVMREAGRDVTAVMGWESDRRSVRGLAAQLDPGRGRRAVWLDLGTPRPLRGDERALFAVLCGYFGQAVARAELYEDHRTVATTLQRSILGPTEVPASMAVRYLPAVQPLEVGGDWYDVIDLGGDHLAVVVGDCTGRGLNAAATMGQMRSACRALLLQSESPAEVVAGLDAFAERLPSAMCTTVFCGVIHQPSGTFRYTSAGHLPALVVNPDGSGLELGRGQGVPLGFSSGAERPEATCCLAPGSTLVMYTDGLVERRSESLDTGIERLRTSLVRAMAEEPEQVVDDLLADMVPGRMQEDDIAVLLYRRPAAAESGDRFSVAVRSDPAELSAFRRGLRDWLECRGVEESQVNEVLIACGEACANAIEHAYSFQPDQLVEVDASLVETTLTLTVADHGKWKEGSGGENRGRGLAIMRALADEVAVERGGGGTVVRMVKQVGP